VLPRDRAKFAKPIQPSTLTQEVVEILGLVTGDWGLVTGDWGLGN